MPYRIRMRLSIRNRPLRCCRKRVPSCRLKPLMPSLRLSVLIVEPFRRQLLRPATSRREDTALAVERFESLRYKGPPSLQCSQKASAVRQAPLIEVRRTVDRSRAIEKAHSSKGGFRQPDARRRKAGLQRRAESPQAATTGGDRPACAIWEPNLRWSALGTE